MFTCEICGCTFDGDYSPICGKQLCYDAFMKLVSMRSSWGPEDGGVCPCGGYTCDGTCEKNTKEVLR